MKKFLSALLCLVIIFSMPLAIFAVECEHSFTAETTEKNCLEKEHTVYSCTLCDYSYTVYADSYTAPDGFYLLYSTEKAGDTLRLDISLYNNPGIQASQITFNFNREALEIVSTDAGEIWASTDFAGDMSWKPEASHMTFFADGAYRNTNNGLFASVTFKILDDNASYNITHKKTVKPFVDWDDENNVVIDRAYQVINIAGKSELGKHSYKNAVCTVCSAQAPNSYTLTLDNEAVKYCAGETVELSYAQSYLDSGRRVRFLGWSGDTEVLSDAAIAPQSFAMPEKDITLTSLYGLVGDLNDDGLINTIDYNLLKRVLTGAEFNPLGDIDADGISNSIDTNLFKRILIGIYIPEK